MRNETQPISLKLESAGHSEKDCLKSRTQADSETVWAAFVFAVGSPAAVGAIRASKRLHRTQICSLPLVPLLPLSVVHCSVVKASFGRVRPFLGRVASRKLGRNSARRLDPYSPQDWTSRLVRNHRGSSQLRT